MALTPEQIQEIRARAGVQPLDQSTGSPTMSFADRVKQDFPDLYGNTVKEEPSLGSKIADRYKSAKQDILNTPSDIANTITDPNKNILEKVGDTVDSVKRVPLRAMGLAGGAIGDVIGSGIDAGIEAAKIETQVPGASMNLPEDTPAPDTTSEPSPASDMIQKAMQKWQEFSAANPQKAKDFEDVGNALNLLGLEGVAKSGAVAAGKTGVKDAAKGVKNIFTKDAASIIKSNIDAINPELSGKKLSEAYKQVVTGDRTIKKAGIFSEQSLSASDRAIKIAERLGNGVSLADGTVVAPLELEVSSVKNLPKLKTALQNTEVKLQEALLKDPLIKANKDGLLSSLQKGLGEAPRDFRIGPNKPITEDVFAFANEVADKADDSIMGLREARSLFDSQAKIQYPTAFKDGAIDTKTAAGNAIKKARDIFNEHLYNTAPNGSDIQKLIGHEADIYQATESVATKAAKGEGMTKIQKASKAIKEHPVAGAATIYGAYEVGKNALGQ